MWKATPTGVGGLWTIAIGGANDLVGKEHGPDAPDHQDYNGRRQDGPHRPFDKGIPVSLLSPLHGGEGEFRVRRVGKFVKGGVGVAEQIALVVVASAP